MCGLSDADARGQHIVGKGQVHDFVISGIDCSRSAEEGHAPTLTVQHHGLSDIVFLPVEGHDVTRGRHPQRQLHRRGRLEISQFHHQFMREGVGCPMSAVVHHQRPTLHLLLNQSCHVRITVARRRGRARIGIPVDLLQLVALMVRLHHSGHLVGSLHVRIVIAVVAHEAEHVLPGSRMLVVSIADGLVSQDGRTLQGPDGKTPYCHIGLAQIGQAHATLLLNLFLVIEQTEEIVADEAIYRTERVVALETEQEIVKIIAAPLGTVHTVVPGTVAIEQQVSGHVRLRRSPVVEHLHITAIGRSVGSSTRELIIQLVGRHDPHAQTVALLMQRLDAFSLCQPLLRSGYDDHHVHSLVGMMVLVGDGIHIFWFRQGRCLEIWFVLRRIMHEGDIVQSEVRP